MKERGARIETRNDDDDKKEEETNKETRGLEERGLPVSVCASGHKGRSALRSNMDGR